MKNLAFLIFIFFSKVTYGQNDSINKCTYKGYGELYYSYDFANPSNREKNNFIYNHKRHNELNANLLFMKASYLHKNVRGNIGLMAGNYVTYNLKSEPIWVQPFLEANMGLRISRKHNLWIDAGILPSHLGFESTISSDCWTLTRSILAENSPYYELGAKISYSNKAENFDCSFLLLNGWQRIKINKNEEIPALGFQFNYKPYNTLKLSYNNYLGQYHSNQIETLRMFHNFFMQYTPKGKFGMIAGFDLGMDTKKNDSTKIWYAPIIILKYQVTKKLNSAIRTEYYNDKNEAMIPTYTQHGFQVMGLSLNIDYQWNDKIQSRIEGKYYQAKDAIFLNNSKSNYSITTNITASF